MNINMKIEGKMIVMMKMEKICPGNCPCMRENATRFRFTAFRISSMDIRMITTFLRVSTPIVPMANSAAEATSNGRQRAKRLA